MDYYPLNSYFSSDISDELDLSITNSVDSLFSDIPEESTNQEVPIKKKRGRPPKPKVEQITLPSTTETVVAAPKKRGRPPGSGKKKTVVDPTVPVIKRPRGRPRKHSLPSGENSSSEISSNEIDFGASSDNPASDDFEDEEKPTPTDYQIAETIRTLSKQFEFRRYTPEQVRYCLEEHFGVNLQCRLWYITEVYQILCC